MAISEDIEQERKNKAKLAKIRQTSNDGKAINTTKLGLPNGWSRTSLTMRDKHLSKLKDLARLEGTSVKDTLDQILAKALSSINFESMFDELKKKWSNDKDS